MPAVPEALFFEAIDAVAGTCRDIIPRESGRALYLRPCLFGTEGGCGRRRRRQSCGEYAPSLRASSAAVTRGFTVALWLDAREQRFIQELSGMNTRHHARLAPYAGAASGIQGA